MENGISYAIFMHLKFQASWIADFMLFAKGQAPDWNADYVIWNKKKIFLNENYRNPAFEIPVIRMPAYAMYNK